MAIEIDATVRSCWAYAIVKGTQHKLQKPLRLFSNQAATGIGRHGHTGAFEAHTRWQPICLSHHMSFLEDPAHHPDDQDYLRSRRRRLFR